MNTCIEKAAVFPAPKDGVCIEKSGFSSCKIGAQYYFLRINGAVFGQLIGFL